MAKYHINAAGNPGACSAEKGNCPFGGDADHFTSPEAARAAFESSQTGAFSAPAVGKSEISASFNLERVHPKDSHELYDFVGAEKAAKKLTDAIADRDAAIAEHQRLASIRYKSLLAESDRFLMALEEDGDRTWEQALREFSLPKLSELEERGLRSHTHDVYLMNYTVAKLRKEHKARFAKLPMRYLKTLQDSHFEKLIDVAAAVEEKNPGWTPEKDALPELANARSLPDRAAGGYRRVEGGMVSMQHVEPPLAKLLQRYVLDTYGVDKAEDFWQAVKSAQTSVNRPLITHFVKVENERRKARGEKVLGALR